MSTWKIVAIAGGVLIAGFVLLGAVGLGMDVDRARFIAEAAQGGKLGSALPGLLPAWPGRHGLMGRVECVDPAARTIAVMDVRGERRLVLLRQDTVLERPHGQVELSTIRSGERVVVIGSPDGQGRLQARAVRVLVQGEGAPDKPAPGAEMLYRILRLMPPWFHRLLWRFV